MTTTIGIIGGSGLYDIDGLSNRVEQDVVTPFGPPSSKIISGYIDDAKLLFIARHGLGHILLPSEVNYRANIYALKLLGAEWCLSVSAVGGLQEEYAPGHLVVPDQIIDRTRNRINTFFGEGLCAHVAFASPYCPVLSAEVFDVANEVALRFKTKAHRRGTYLCMEGPAFSTRAESIMYRSWGASVIGMTALPEAKLAREAEIAYSTLALITDYDCWRTEDADVDVSEILETLSKNVQLSKQIIINLAPRLGKLKPSSLATKALDSAIVTNFKIVPEATKQKLKPLLTRFFN